jgi:hypothetical protein
VSGGGAAGHQGMIYIHYTPKTPTPPTGYDISIKNNGNWLKASGTWVKNNGNWIKVVGVWVKNNGSWLKV